MIIDEREPFVGTVEFSPRPGGAVELVYGLFPPARGRGIATRAVRLASDWALKDGSFERVELFIGKDNAVSRPVAEKAGFDFVRYLETQRTGTSEVWSDALYFRSRPYP